MFRDWTAKARSLHPEMDFTIKDESVLVNDLVSCARSAVNSLRADEKKTRREIPGYDVGFMLGYISSSLNEHWVHEYIRKRSEDYKILIALKALRIYLELDEVVLIKINKLYSGLYQDDVNFTDLDLTARRKQFKDFGSKLDIPLEDESGDSVLIGVHNLITERVLKIIDKKSPELMPETREYFSTEEIELMLEDF